MKLKHHYSNERNAQIVIALLKAHNIKKIVASPGSTNISFVGSVQTDPYFEVYSCVDERSAAYMAVGLSEESDEPVVISCTGATASRNYLSALTEAYYRKIKIIALTSTHEQALLGNLIPQVIDRNVSQNDISVYSALIPTVKDANDEWDCQIKVNRALNALYKNGGGPVHMNLETANRQESFGVEEIKDVKHIRLHTIYTKLPELPKGRIGIFIGSHANWSHELTESVEKFCEINNAVVFCDQTSGYTGKYKIMAAMLGAQDKYRPEVNRQNLMIHIGELSGSYESYQTVMFNGGTWRVSEDGEVKDLFHRITRVFQMPEIEFFKHYAQGEPAECEYYKACRAEYDSLISKIPELPLSNLWVAKNTVSKLPHGSEIHFAILNSLRSWNFFELDNSIRAFSNVGGFGIDGGISSMVGASLCHKDKLYFGVFGDLSFFYDMNILGNRHVGSNLRIILINNGKGTEFRNYYHQAVLWGDDADKFIAAGGHFGRKSSALVKHYAEDLGFEYLTASSKDEYNLVIERFVNPVVTDKPILFEIFTNSEDETQALFMLRNMEKSNKEAIKQTVSAAIKSVVGQEGLNTIKKVIKY